MLLSDHELSSTTWPGTLDSGCSLELMLLAAQLDFFFPVFNSLKKDLKFWMLCLKQVVRIITGVSGAEL